MPFLSKERFSIDAFAHVSKDTYARLFIPVLFIEKKIKKNLNSRQQEKSWIVDT